MKVTVKLNEGVWVLIGQAEGICVQSVRRGETWERTSKHGGY